MILSGIVLTLLCVTVYGPVPCSATEVWSENFDSAPDWFLWGCGIDEGWLRLDGSKKNIVNESIGYANRSSSTVVGTWEFDIVELGSTSGEVNVWFIADTPNLGTATYYSIRLTRAATDTGSFPIIGLWRSLGGENVKLGSYDGQEGPKASHHIEISRDSAGQMRVYVNRTLRIAETDTDIDSSAYFVFHGHKMGAALDNIVVDDEIPIELPWELILLVAGAAVVIVVGVVVVKRRG